MTDKYEVRDDEMDQVVGGIVGGKSAMAQATATIYTGRYAANMGNMKPVSEKQ